MGGACCSSRECDNDQKKVESRMQRHPKRESNVSTIDNSNGFFGTPSTSAQNRAQSEEIDLSFTSQMTIRYSPQFQKKVLRTIAKLINTTLRSDQGIARYNYGTISDFLQVHQADQLKVVPLILQDMNWRAQNLPVARGQLLEVLRSAQLYLYGSDINNHPCIYLHTTRGINSSPISGLKSPRERVQNSASLSVKEIKRFLIYLFENLDSVVKRKCNYLIPKQFTLLVDVQQGNFPIDILEGISQLDSFHYPMRIGHVHILNIALDKITDDVKQRYKKSNLLSTRGRMYNEMEQLLVQFDQMKLSKHFGGQCENVYKLMPFSNVDDFLVKLVE